MAKKTYFTPVFLTMTVGDGSIDLTKSQQGAVGTGTVVTNVVEFIQSQYSETDYAIIIANHPVSSWSAIASDLGYNDLSTLESWEALGDYFAEDDDCNFSWK